MLDTNWGVAVGYLAARCAAASGPGYITALDVATEAKLSVPFTHKIMRVMCRQGLFRSVRGKGYKLARPKDQISVLDVLEALVGPALFQTCCPLQAPECPTRQQCALWNACSQARESLRRELAQLTLDKLPLDEAGKPACLQIRSLA
jgi:Rrf2 family protein